MPLRHSPQQNNPLSSENFCGICCSEMSNTQPCFCTPCNHVFHKACLEEWFPHHDDCPNCSRVCTLSQAKLVVGNCSPNKPQPEPTELPGPSGITTRSLAKALEVVQTPANGHFQPETGKISEGNGKNTQLSQIPTVGSVPVERTTRPTRSKRTRAPAKKQVPKFPPGRSSGPAVVCLSGLDASRSSNQTKAPSANVATHSSPWEATNARTAPLSQGLDLDVLQQIIERTVARAISTLQIQPPASPQEGYARPNIPTPVSCINSMTSLRTAKTANIMQKWNVPFDGSTEGLGVEEFIYRVKTLTDETLDSDFLGLCKHLHILLVGKARDWYWRYHKQVDRIVWTEFCAALRQQYKDYRSEFMSKELIRARKQHVGEPFVAFHDAVAGLIDKFGIKMAEEELIEILKANLLPETRHKILYQSISSVGQLRRLVQMQENLVQELQKSDKSRPPVGRRSIHSLEESRTKSDQEEYEDISVEAIQSSTAKRSCWNCEELGHVWENCMANRRIFCYGCGAPNVYKPQCQTCIRRASENRQKGASNNSRMPPKNHH
ncbi:uncharacterized protein LOC117191964 [Drosophila miranda]|uniref:uncharacterized protein LOC117191964 n=1 Tax=Drosophila miranda TaxID=7229 RepID=UPI00143F6A38|nr:uncharacterized protein LOC117191964 [Drosophila miranda]